MSEIIQAIIAALILSITSINVALLWCYSAITCFKSPSDPNTILLLVSYLGVLIAQKKQLFASDGSKSTAGAPML